MTEGEVTQHDAAIEVPESVDVTPTPKILKLIAEIEFRPWQCTAELIDNSFDEFLAIKRAGISWDEPHEVSVSLPSARAPLSEGAVVVVDNGRGMTLEQVRNAVRAGYTGRDPISNLGLFGMGFNVATARLGGVTRFLTTRAGDPDWIGVEVDVDHMGEGFRAPVVREPKSSPEEHGTKVEIRRLKRLSEWLTRPTNQTRLRRTLGSIYSYLLDAEGFRLSVNSIAVDPRRQCVWNRERSVTRGGDQIPAVIDVNAELGERAVCTQCGTWQNRTNTECDECEGTALEIRERIVRGWLGIARNIDGKEFGVDFLRNGRKILAFDKSIFEWNDPDDPSGEGEVEYPIEVPPLGRIVGEIHLDHVGVSYTKDAFNSDDPAWHAAVRLIRGQGPLRPRKAAELGYGPNTSPLARLYTGYRRNDPGLNYLTPGNGTRRLDTSEWVKLFHAGDPDYQSDEKWWQAVLDHERLVAERRAEEAAREQRQAVGVADPTAEFVADITETGAGPDAMDDVEPEPPRTPTPLTEEERVELLRTEGARLPEVSAEFSATGVAGRPMHVESYAVRQPIEDAENRRVPVWMTGHRGGTFVAFVDVTHPHFAYFDDDPEDVVLMEVAQNLLVRAHGATVAISAVFAELKRRHLSAHGIDANRLIPEAVQLLQDVRERMVPCIAENPMRPWQNVLLEPERHLTRDRIAEALRTANLDEAIYSGDYLLYAPPAVIPRVVEEWPEAFLDGKVFRAPYSNLGSPSAMRLMVAAITGYLTDLAWLAEAPIEPRRVELIRARMSLQLLPDELA